MTWEGSADGHFSWRSFQAAPLFLFMHGKDVTIPKGTEITAYINGDIPLEPIKFQTQAATQPGAETSPAQPSSAAPTAQSANGADPVLCTVEVKSNPDGSEITVDDKYIGSTPSILKLAAGDHKIKLEKSGFKTWEKTLTVSSGASATVDPTLEKE